MNTLKTFKTSDRVKRFCRWGIWGATLFFIARTLIQNWPEVRSIDLTPASWRWLALAWVTSLMAHAWAGWVWHWLLRAWEMPLGGWWAMRVYLFTNVAKYLPGNIWHFYGRVRAVQEQGGSLGRSLASVVAEPLVMAVAALGLGAIASGLFYLGDTSNSANSIGSGPLWTLGLLAGWAIALVLLHPRLLNPRLKQMSRLKMKRLMRPGSTRLEKSVSSASQGPVASASRATSAEIAAASVATSAQPADAAEAQGALRLKSYPLRPLLGEMGFVLGRSLGFIVTVMALTPVSAMDLPLLVSAFSLAWLLGLVVPGAPGGIGVFEASAIVLLGGQFPTGIILGSVACYRLVGTLAEVTGAAFAWLAEAGNGLGGDR